MGWVGGKAISGGDGELGEAGRYSSFQERGRRRARSHVAARPTNYSSSVCTYVHTVRVPRLECCAGGGPELNTKKRVRVYSTFANSSIKVAPKSDPPRVCEVCVGTGCAARAEASTSQVDATHARCPAGHVSAVVPPAQRPTSPCRVQPVEGLPDLCWCCRFLVSVPFSSTLAHPRPLLAPQHTRVPLLSSGVNGGGGGRKRARRGHVFCCPVCCRGRRAARRGTTACGGAPAARGGRALAGGGDAAGGGARRSGSTAAPGGGARQDGGGRVDDEERAGGGALARQGAGPQRAR